MRICFQTFLGQEGYMTTVVLAGLGTESKSYLGGLRLSGGKVWASGPKRHKYSSLLCVNNYKVLSRLTNCSAFQAVPWKQIHLALCVSWSINRHRILNADNISYQWIMGAFSSLLCYSFGIYGLVINMGSDTRWVGESPRRWVPVLACREGLLGKLYFTFILQGDVALAPMWLQVVVKPMCFILRQIMFLAELESVTGSFRKLLN